MNDAWHEVEVMIHLVNHGNEGDDDKPKHHHEGCHDRRQHQGVEGGVEVVFLPELRHEVLH